MGFHRFREFREVLERSEENTKDAPSVAVVPILHLQLGTNMNPDDIEEGDDVYFECKVHANPGAYKVVWRHNVS
jgi:hypothetical protein